MRKKRIYTKQCVSRPMKLNAMTENQQAGLSCGIRDISAIGSMAISWPEAIIWKAND